MVMHVLIIDDDSDDTEIFCAALREVAPSFECTMVNNPKAALTMLAQPGQVPNYIFLDAHMFTIDGKDCLKALRNMDALKSTYIIMYSGYISEKEVEELKSLGANNYMNKPSSFEALKKMLATLFIKQNHTEQQ